MKEIEKELPVGKEETQEGAEPQKTGEECSEEGAMLSSVRCCLDVQRQNKKMADTTPEHGNIEVDEQVRSQASAGFPSVLAWTDSGHGLMRSSLEMGS